MTTNPNIKRVYYSSFLMCLGLFAGTLFLSIVAFVNEKYAACIAMIILFVFLMRIIPYKYCLENEGVIEKRFLFAARTFYFADIVDVQYQEFGRSRISTVVLKDKQGRTMGIPCSHQKGAMDLVEWMKSRI